MPLFPDVDQSASSINIKKNIEDFYDKYASQNQYFQQEASRDNRFEAGDQTIWTEVYGSNPLYSRKNFNFNRIKRIVNMITGHQRKNRKSINVIPVENSDQQTSDQFTKIIQWINRTESLYETISDAFQSSVIGGLSLVNLSLDYRNDPLSGNIKIDTCTYDSFIIDPFFKKKDLSDCSGIWKRTYVTKAAAKSYLPQKDHDEIDSLSDGFRDYKFEYMPESNYLTSNNLIPYDEFYYSTFRKQRLLYDPQNNESFEWTSDDKNLNEYLRLYPEVKVIDQDIPTVKVAILLAGQVFYDGLNPIGIDKYPFVPFFGYFNPAITDYALKLNSVVRGLRDPQYLFNRRKVIELDILESQINSGYKYKVGSLVNPKDVFKTGQGRGLAIKKNANLQDIERINPPQIPPSMLELSRGLSNEIQEISGVSEELLGSATDDKAGILSMLRQGASLTTLQVLFDNLDNSQKLLGRLLISTIQSNFSPGKIKNIIEEEPSPQFYNKNFGRYDAAIEDGVNTSTQRQMELSQLLHLKEVTNIPIPDTTILRAATISNKDELIKDIEQQQQIAAEQDKQRAQLEMAEIQARIDLAHGRANADNSLGYERVSRVPENRAMAIANIAEANKDDEQAALNKAKMIAELEKMDLENLDKLFAIAAALKNTEQSSKNKLAQEANVNPTPKEGLEG